MKRTAQLPQEEELERKLAAATPRVTRSIGLWSGVNLTRRNAVLSVEMFKRTRSPALWAIHRAKDGTLSVTESGHPVPMATVGVPMPQEPRLLSKTRALLIQALGTRLREHGGLIEALYPQEKGPSRINLSLNTTAKLITLKALGQEPADGDTPDKMEREFEQFTEGIHEEANRLVNEHILDPNVTGMTRGWLPSRTWDKTVDTQVYNWMVNNISAMQSVDSATPGMALYYGQRVWKPSRDGEKIHPGQIIAEIKEETGLTGAKWKAFCRTGPGEFLNLHNNREWDRDGERNQVLHIVCQAIADTNQPKAGARSRVLISLAGRCQYYQVAEWERGNAWRAWVQLLNRFLDPRNERAQLSELQRVEDSLRRQIETGENWGPGNWETLVNRAEHWHRARTIQGQERHRRADYNRRWASTLGETEHAGVTFTPVLSGRELHRLGDEMGNCLGSYSKLCEQGETRIFTVTSNGEIAAVAEINRVGNVWRLGQIEGRHRSKPTPDTMAKIALLPRLYEGAEIEARENAAGDEEREY